MAQLIFKYVTNGPSADKLSGQQQQQQQPEWTCSEQFVNNVWRTVRNRKLLLYTPTHGDTHTLTHTTVPVHTLTHTCKPNPTHTGTPTRLLFLLYHNHCQLTMPRRRLSEGIWRVAEGRELGEGGGGGAGHTAEHGWCVDNLWDFRKNTHVHFIVIIYITKLLPRSPRAPSQRQKGPENKWEEDREPSGRLLYTL